MFVQLDFIVVVERGGDAALSIFGRRFAQAVFRDDEHAAGGGEFDSRAKARHAGSDYDEIRLDVLDGEVDIHIIRQGGGGLIEDKRLDESSRGGRSAHATRKGTLSAVAECRDTVKMVKR